MCIVNNHKIILNAIFAFFVMFSFGNLSAQEQEEDIELAKIRENISKLQTDYEQGIFSQHQFFFLQAGIGIAIAHCAALGCNALTDKNIWNTTIGQKSLIQFHVPTVSMKIGFNQSFSVGILAFGFRLSLAYEIGVDLLSNLVDGGGNSTTVYRNGGGYFDAYIGLHRFMIYGGVGYEFLGSGTTFLPNETAPITINKKGHAWTTGLIFIINKYGSIDLSTILSKNYGFVPRFFINYEYRF